MATESFSPASSAIANITYDDDTNELFLTFTSGHIYTLDDFPQIEFERWKSSDSAGSYFNSYVRGKYSGGKHGYGA